MNPKVVDLAEYRSRAQKATKIHSEAVGRGVDFQVVVTEAQQSTLLLEQQIIHLVHGRDEQSVQAARTSLRILRVRLRLVQRYGWRICRALEGLTDDAA